MGLYHPTLKDPNIYLYGLYCHALSLSTFTLNLFLPSIISDLGYSVVQVQQLSIPPYLVGFITTMYVAVLAERMKQRAPFVIGNSAVGIVGYVMSI